MASKTSGNVDFSYSDHPLPNGLTWCTPADPKIAELTYTGTPVAGEWIQNDSHRGQSLFIDFTDHVGATHRLIAGSRVVANSAGNWIMCAAKSANPVASPPLVPASTLIPATNGNVSIRVSLGAGLMSSNSSTADCWRLDEKMGSSPGDIVEVDTGEVVIRGPGYMVQLSAGDSAEFQAYPTVWKKVIPAHATNVAPSGFKRITCGKVEIEYSDTCSFVTQPSNDPITAELIDLGSALGATITNVSNTKTKTCAIKLSVPLAKPIMIYEGYQTTCEVNGWSKPQCVIATAVGPAPQPLFTRTTVGNLTVNYCDKCLLTAIGQQTSPNVLDVVEAGSKAGAVIKNETVGGNPTYVNIWKDSSKSQLLTVIFNGGELTFDGQHWGNSNLVKMSMTASVTVPVKGSTETTVNFNLVGATTLKKCTCGNLNHGTCSTWCDLVRTDG